MSNFGLYKAFDELGIEYAKTAVGDKYVYEYMMMNGCRLGGEQSGHIIFSKYASTGDGILTSLKMMEVMLAKKKTMSQLCDGLTIYPQVLKNVRVADKTAAQSDPDVQAAVSAAAEKLGVQVYLPPLSLCGDNAAMIGAQGYYEYLAGNTAGMELNAYATKSILGETL